MPRVSAVLLVLLALMLPACKPPPGPAERVYAIVVSPAGGRKTASMEIATEWRAKRLTLDQCIDLGFEMLESLKAAAAAGNGVAPAPVREITPTSLNATAFAGAVLDATLLLERELPHGADTEIFWQRLGGLAFAAAEEARAAGRGPEALVLVTGGAKRWQTEAYWHLHPTHDGLVSWLLAEAGDKGEAMARLRRRAQLEGFALETYQKLGGGGF
ncbi:MAG TPA: hypothetical protein VD997_07840 [Phycisphaerales bacterium]|nr:hypothetical protein [Phycisphaerales bacterium]